MKKSRKLILTFALAAIFVLSAVSAASALTWTRNGIKYTHPSLSLSDDTAIFDGVDVSNWQGTINWSKVKYAGMDFAFIRCGYTALGSFRMYEDSRYSSYVAGCRSNGISLGVYYYANCMTLSEARSEANFTVQLLRKYSVNPQQPVVMDYEFGNGRLTTAWKSWVNSSGVAYARKRMTQNAMEYMRVIKKAGYTPMFYSYLYITSPNSGSRRFNVSDMQKAGYDKLWMAQYAKTCTYPGKVNYWQYTSSGGVAGISGRADMNFMYYDDSGSGTVSGTKSIRNCSISIPYSSMKYTGKALYPEVTVKNGSKKLTEGEDYVLSYMDNIKKGTASIIVKGIGSYSNDMRL
ncbi:MAG: GH25 family lysozyme, partial [Anaerovoracaceae bacterium]